MTKEDLDALQALAEKAGGGEWTASGATVQIPETEELAGKSLSITGLDKSVGKLYARYIAAANPQTILSLIARIRELEGDTGKSAEAWHRLVMSLGCMFDFDTSGSLEEVAASAAAARDRRAAPEGGKEGGE